MSVTVPYSEETITIPNILLDGNESSDNPVQFDIVPAWGADLARMRSIINSIEQVADDDSRWMPATQESTIKGFETGPAGFINVVTAVRGITIPAAMAKRAGLLVEKGAKDLPITTGYQFARIAGAMLPFAQFVATEVVKLTSKQKMDARFFAQPSGSGGPATSAATTMTAGNVRKPSRRRATADGSGKTGSQPAGTSGPSA